jgi:hypothetical protein
MTNVRFDPHAHMYESYSLKKWVDAAIGNLTKDLKEILPVVFIVDREGQDSFARLRKEAPLFGDWEENPDGRSGLITVFAGKLLVVRGVQYVAKEKIEVLGLGVSRRVADGAPASDLIELIREEGGVPCLPWSPGKWLGRRGRLVRQLLESHTPKTLTVGDISMRTFFGPPSPLLRFARGQGYSMLYGTDPLPRKGDEQLVGSFGRAIKKLPEGDLVSAILESLYGGAETLKTCGRRNSALRAALRYFWK